MKIQELRIGNWFIGYNGKPFQWSLGHFGLLTLKKNRLEIDDIIKSPIPLTEEILFKCGFYQENGVMSYVTQDYSDTKITYETLAKYYRLYPYTYRIDYLHQLQNLYFALTGEELEVKL